MTNTNSQPASARFGVPAAKFSDDLSTATSVTDSAPALVPGSEAPEAEPSSRATDLRLHIGCDATFTSEWPVSMYFLVLPREGTHEPVQETLEFFPDTPYTRQLDSFGNQLLMLKAPAGSLRIRYDALVDIHRAADPVLAELQTTPIEELPGDVVQFLWPSRYCQSDLLIDEAWRLFGHVPDGWSRVQAVCDWIHENIEYGKGSTSATASQEVLEQRRGVCRDFALLGVTFCRALNIPARYVCGYLPDIEVEPPDVAMDFHAWFEVYLGGEWRTFDARHNIPRIGRVLIAVGRDAADCAWSTSFGNARLTAFSVVADEVPGSESA